jgi:alpha-beta hydrolase superfamily lysophospholipase
MSEPLTLTTSDRVQIAADWYPVAHPKWFAILLHMRPATKESWKPWAEKLNALGIACLAYDQRGHGASTMSGTIHYESLGDREAKEKPLDLEAAFEWLRETGAEEARTILLGASIGANLAIRFASAHPDIRFVAALSPGINFRGVATDDAIQQLSALQTVVLVASDDDTISADSAATLHDLAPERTVFIQKSGLGHGTIMLEKDPTLFDEIVTHLP